MTNNTGYGVVYTPDLLSDYVAHLLIDQYTKDVPQDISRVGLTVLDPACGEGALLSAAERKFQTLSNNQTVRYVGIDVDKIVISKNSKRFNMSNYQFCACDALLPAQNVDPIKYWFERGLAPDLVIANPPWSSEKIYSKQQLTNAGYRFDVGQYDSYVLFIELCINLLKPNGYAAFIIPDSIFSGENKELRKYLAENTQLRVISRLGEKLFAGVNRATTVLIIKKAVPTSNTQTECFRLTTDQRRMYLSGKATLTDCHENHAHFVLQQRFRENSGYTFDVDTQQEEEVLLRKMEKNSTLWEDVFHFGRGVEISKTGMIVICPHCGVAQGYSKKQFVDGRKKCSKCTKEVSVTNETIQKIVALHPLSGYKKVYVGENLHRYSINGSCFIKMDVPGINYKEEKLYEPPKILIRKTGLGINACIDYESTYISQTVYSCNYLDAKHRVPLEYYLGVLNSRVLYYYYLKKYGENEWKSHPYFTKDIIFSLPIPQATEGNSVLVKQIAANAALLQSRYSRAVDIQTEKLVAELYGLSHSEMDLVTQCMNELPDLGAINHMKIKEDELCLDI